MDTDDDPLYALGENPDARTTDGALPALDINVQHIKPARVVRGREQQELVR